MRPSDTQYDAQQKLERTSKRDRKIHTILLMTAALLLLADLGWIGYLILKRN